MQDWFPSVRRLLAVSLWRPLRSNDYGVIKSRLFATVQRARHAPFFRGVGVGVAVESGCPTSAARDGGGYGPSSGDWTNSSSRASPTRVLLWCFRLLIAACAGVVVPSLQVLTALRLCLSPVGERKSLLPPAERAVALKLLLLLPVNKSDLKDSELGRLIMSMSQDTEETTENRELLRRVRSRSYSAVRDGPPFIRGPRRGGARSRIRGGSGAIDITAVPW